MSFFDKFKRSVDSFAANVFHAIGYDAAGMCQIETVFDDQTFVLSNGGLLTLIEIEGMRSMPGEDDYFRVISNFERSIKSAFSQGAHTVSLVFERDAESTRDDIERNYQIPAMVSRRLRVDISDIFESDIDRLAQYVVSERCFMTVATHPQSLTKDDYKEALQKQVETMKNSGLPILSQSQNPLKVLPILVNRHKTFVESIASESSGSDILLKTRVLNVDEAARQIRCSIDRDFTSPQWRPSVPGGHADSGKKRSALCPFPRIAPSKFDGSHYLPPLMGAQLVPRDIQKSGSTIRVGDRFFRSLVMELGPQTPEGFLQLFRQIHRDVPWRIVFTLVPNGLDLFKLTKIYTSILGFMGDNNRRIKDALDGLSGMQADGEIVVGFQITVMTWAYDEKTLSKNISRLATSMQSWGSIEVGENVGNPVLSFFANIPGFTHKSPAPMLAAPLSDVMPMLPLMRPASPWSRAIPLFRTPDGKIYPVENMSAEQDTFNRLIFAPPGSGKSVTMNSENLAFCFSSASQNVLPLMLILDIGPSSSGLISVLKDALPEQDKHLVGYYKLRNTRDCAINVFATQLGCRRPTPRERASQVNFITLLATPVGSQMPWNMAGELAGLLVDEVYAHFSDKNRPKLYEAYIEPIVDQALQAIGHTPVEGETWWQIVDLLFDRGMNREAQRAQDYASPMLSDLMTVLGNQSVTDMFNRDDGSAVMAGNGQRLVDAMATIISSALREYPILNGITKFDMGSSRVVSLDLNEVASGDDPVSKRRTAIMYFLAYAYATRNFFVDSSITGDSTAPGICGDRYRSYHAKRIDEIKAVPKSIVMDEFHKTGGLSALRAEIVYNMREGRKWRISVVLASQLMEDFSDEMVKLMTSLYIMKAPNQSDIDNAQHLFNLSDVAATRTANELTGPTKAGAPFLAIFQTKKGRYSQILFNTIGAVKQWALTTTAEDMVLRDRLYSAIGGKESRRLLMEYFPSGSAQGEIKRREANVTEENKENIVDVLVSEILQGRLRKE